MKWLIDPTMWLGLATLILLEIVLGIDNLVFIAILSEKVPRNQRQTVRLTGLSLALLIRVALLAGVFWLTTLTRPLFFVLGHGFSSRDLILLVGGLFLLLKATVEIHDRLEVEPPDQHRETEPSRFGITVAQIVVLDAVFSVDSILTAVGMTNQLPVMITAVTVAMALMLLASTPLTEFVNAHPPLIILCLGFLLMIGLSLIADSVGFHIPKGYLYAAIGFSVLIESLNQIALRNRRRWIAKIPRRQRVAETVLRLLSGIPAKVPATKIADAESMSEGGVEAFAPVEKQMIRGVLSLADQTIGSIMTPRRKIEWVDLHDPASVIVAGIKASRHAQLLVGEGSIDHVVGIVRKQDLLDQCLESNASDVRAVMKSPTIIYEDASVLDTLELFKSTPVHTAIVVDEFGGLQGMVTQTDLLEAIAGDLPDPQGKNEPEIVRRGDGSFVVDAGISSYVVKDILDLQELPDDDYHTLAGFALSQIGRIPGVGDGFDFEGWRFEVSEMNGPRVSKILVSRRQGRKRFA